MDNQNLLAAIEELLDKKLEPINNKLDNMEKKLNAVFDQVADLTEFKTEVKEKLDNIRDDINAIEYVTSKNWNEITKLKIAK
ncbi:hypothetical protein [Caloramator sp. Dgby_cultured_2]|uniref:hypothetical protein n=1 Tax=Caloramator sp. Dgby_cultured_2 TaxID=3029174 RepID=UPI00237EDC93|nr:hypothetical protein [Caloramator sp. Dgby_cultured_2]WDU82824.1 hypothetical protein PWK10_15160 [Caloramator sp. Dgby_cultured_2]